MENDILSSGLPGLKLFLRFDKSYTPLLKQIKLRPVTEIHDYNFKLKNAQKIRSKGD